MPSYLPFATATQFDERVSWLLFGCVLGAAAVVLLSRVIAEWFGKRIE